VPAFLLIRQREGLAPAVRRARLRHASHEHGRFAPTTTRISIRRDPSNGSSDMDFSSGTVLRRLGFCANSLHRVPHATIFYVTIFYRHSPVGNPFRSDARIGSTGASSG
jgi:hypothetical protein